MSNLNAEQIQELREEFVDFKIREMTHEDMYAWIRDVFLHELEKCTEDEIKDEIDEYDDNLYDVLVPYVLDEENSHAILQEYIHDRREQW